LRASYQHVVATSHWKKVAEALFSDGGFVAAGKRRDFCRLSRTSFTADLTDPRPVYRRIYRRAFRFPMLFAAAKPEYAAFRHILSPLCPARAALPRKPMPTSNHERVEQWRQAQANGIPRGSRL
jgi:hypothetical protein